MYMMSQDIDDLKKSTRAEVIDEICATGYVEKLSRQYAFTFGKTKNDRAVALVWYNHRNGNCDLEEIHSIYAEICFARLKAPFLLFAWTCSLWSTSIGLLQYPYVKEGTFQQNILHKLQGLNMRNDLHGISPHE